MQADRKFVSRQTLTISDSRPEAQVVSKHSHSHRIVRPPAFFRDRAGAVATDVDGESHLVNGGLVQALESSRANCARFRSSVRCVPGFLSIARICSHCWKMRKANTTISTVPKNVATVIVQIICLRALQLVYGQARRMVGLDYVVYHPPKAAPSRKACSLPRRPRQASELCGCPPAQRPSGMIWPAASKPSGLASPTISRSGRFLISGR